MALPSEIKENTNLKRQRSASLTGVQVPSWRTANIFKESTLDGVYVKAMEYPRMLAVATNHMGRSHAV
jgi:hypothetical protein